MAIATTTTSIATAGASVRSLHAGPIERSVRFVSVAGTLSDVTLVMKIPHGAVITEVYGTVASQEVEATFKMGITGAQSEAANDVFGTHTNTGSQTVNWSSQDSDPNSPGSATPYRVSITDGVQPQHNFLYMTKSVGTWSTSVSLAFTVRYHMDNNEAI